MSAYKTFYDSGSPQTFGKTELKINRIEATEEQIQDYVASLFSHSSHENAEFIYDDESNILKIKINNVSITEAKIREDYGSHEFSFTNYINTLLS